MPTSVKSGVTEKPFPLGKLLSGRYGQLAWGATARCADDADGGAWGVQGQPCGTVTCQPTSW